MIEKKSREIRAFETNASGFFPSTLSSDRMNYFQGGGVRVKPRPTPTTMLTTTSEGVELHPQAKRNGSKSTTSSNVMAGPTAVPPSPESPLSVPFFPTSFSTLLQQPSPTKPAPPTQQQQQQQRTSSRPHSSRVQQPTQFQGLPSPPLYPLHPSSSPSRPIRIITASQYAALYKSYQNVLLPEKTLFPWLHGGAEVPFSSASAYFGYRKGNACEAPKK